MSAIKFILPELFLIVQHGLTFGFLLFAYNLVSPKLPTIWHLSGKMFYSFFIILEKQSEIVISFSLPKNSI